MRAAARTVSRSVSWSVRLAGVAGATLRSIPGAAGALLISYGAYEAWHPAGPVVAGVFLLLADRRIP